MISEILTKMRTRRKKKGEKMEALEISTILEPSEGILRLYLWLIIMGKT